jgi:hypothetical protein
MSLKKALFYVLLLAYATWVWPTLYRHDHIGANPIRENRITGEIDFCTLQGWTPQLPPLR